MLASFLLAMDMSHKSLVFSTGHTPELHDGHDDLSCSPTQQGKLKMKQQ